MLFKRTKTYKTRGFSSTVTVISIFIYFLKIIYIVLFKIFTYKNFSN